MGPELPDGLKQAADGFLGQGMPRDSVEAFVARAIDQGSADNPAMAAELKAALKTYLDSKQQ